MRRLVIRPGGIGDVILSLPAMECLRADYLEVWTPTRSVPLVQFADRVRGIASTGLDLLGVTEPPPRLMQELRSFDSIVSWYGTNRPEFRETVKALDLPFTFFSALPGTGCEVHAADFFVRQVCTIADCQSDGIPRIRCPLACPSAPPENFSVIHPFSGSARKNWPLAKFRLLAMRLQGSMEIRWCAGEEDPPLPEAVRFTDLYELACWVARAQLLIGNDSGITHLAAAVGTPVVAIFGATDPAIWAPRGNHVRVVNVNMSIKR